MRKIYTLFALATLTACGNGASNDATKTAKVDTPVASPATAKKETPPPPPPMDSATAAKKYMEYMTPGDMHKMLASSVGTWTAEYTMWEKENGPAQKSTGTCENKMILGGRYLQSTNKSVMMGMPFEGIGTLAYDNGTKKFINTWMDNMGTGVMIMEGNYDTTTHTMSLKGTWDDPIKGKMDVREVCKFPDGKHQEMEMWGNVAGGKEYKWMEMKMVKK
jgi:Protein of unknown function (DUF1579)